ncbi:MFS general substrate transporter-44 [Coleophoma cylindrospora]|uniref:MFS general substrate transporter-44 n=1 Tax=Coleophoma cylindrospora TaxID=1849047 RepID=A0A3D8QP71_9HELO|nr:MFS general substrate transporter-44 [Coleophoma cylindrospora]
MGAPNENSSNGAHSHFEPDNVVVQQLKPTDGGLAAWRLLVAAFIFEALLWGFPISYGVFQDYYSSLPQFAGDSRVALIGTIAQGFYYIGSPFSATITKRFPKYQRHQILLGWPLCIFGLVAGSYTSTINGLVATQGVMYGVGFVTLTYPIISMIDEWWVARKGMAFGIISCASGASGAIMPFIISGLLNKYGHQTTLRAIAVAMAVLTGPLIPVLKGRLPPSEQSIIAKTNWSFLRMPLFYIYGTATLAQGLGFFFPSVYLPSYAAAIGLNSTEGALALATMSIASVLGQFLFGYMSDKKVSVSTLAIISTIVGTVAAVWLWGTAKSLGLLLAFSIIYGLFGYGFGTMRVAMGRAVSDDPSAAVATYSILAFLQGVGNISVGPISSGLLTQTIELEKYAIMKYESLVIFTGACMTLSALIIGAWGIRLKLLQIRSVA